ncbi:hypothetical protein H0H92_010183 [Tricholoma furcatifolium]|nr:hypothetical protein H0H92_010183 [Tricholoma furcatifolium]
MSENGIVDPDFDSLIDRYSYEGQEKVTRESMVTSQIQFNQRWKPTSNHPFPIIPFPPAEAKDVLDEWDSLAPSGSEFLHKYMRHVCIETNYIENIFLLTERSSQDIIYRGVAKATIQCLPASNIQDPEIVRLILHDELSAYEMLPLIQKPSDLTREKFCQIHAILMRTCRFSESGKYIAPRKTRNETRKTVVIDGTTCVETAPYFKVDKELDYICRMVKAHSGDHGPLIQAMVNGMMASIASVKKLQ